MRCVFKFRKYYTVYNSGLKIWLVSGFFCNGTVVLYKVLCIFVLAWCWFFATFLSRRTLCATYFPNLRRELLSYFFRKKFIEIVTWKNLRDSWKPNQTLSINFVLKLRFRENPLWNENLKPNVAWKFTLPKNFALIFLSSENIMQHTTAV